MHEGEQTIPSFGLHPWHLADGWPAVLAQLLSNLDHADRVPKHFPLGVFEQFSSAPVPIALIGECGLDRLSATPYWLQLEAFEAQIQVSEQRRLPLILHCVRALDDVLRLKRGTHQPWIYHGFRGKPKQLRQLLDHGFFVSFGFRHNTESLRACPINRLFLETDDTPLHIGNLYDIAAPLLNTPPDVLNEHLWQNASSLFLQR